jgi:nucleotide-binding universal stress UspA family protein
VTRLLGETDPNLAAASSTPTGMVVGVDGSAGATQALRWALALTDRFGPLTPVVAWHQPWWAVPATLPGGWIGPSTAELETMARDRVTPSLDEVSPELSRALMVHEGPAGPGLVELGRTAALIVVGSRGRGAVADAVLGSTSSHVVRHATVPVAVVPEHATVGDVSRVVVGIDGSPHSVAALAWATVNAPAGATIEAVHAWSYHLATYPEALTLSVELYEDEAQSTLDRTLAAAAETAARMLGPDRPPHPVEARLEYGDPRNVLRRAGEDADLLVVGARGHQGVAHLLVGSVTTSLVHQPVSTVAVVPAPAPAAAAAT